MPPGSAHCPQSRLCMAQNCKMGLKIITNYFIKERRLAVIEQQNQVRVTNTLENTTNNVYFLIDGVLLEATFFCFGKLVIFALILVWQTEK